MNIPSPVVNPENKPFFDAAREGRLLIKRCLACGEHHYYPRAHCPLWLCCAKTVSASCW
jgi:hypothetical protein